MLISQVNDDNDDEDEENSKFWNSPSYHTPEDRIAIAERTKKIEEKRTKPRKEDEKSKYVPKLFSPDGRPYNLNQPKIAFRLNDEDDSKNIILEVSVYK